MTDFGPIAKGEVEFRPLTVFAGPSNSGKSWLAKLVHLMGRLFPRAMDGRSLSYPVDFLAEEEVDEWLAKSELARFPEDPSSWIRTINRENKVRLSKKEANFLKMCLERKWNAVTEHEILRCFGLESPGNFVRNEATGNAKAEMQFGDIVYSMEFDRRHSNMSLDVQLGESPALDGANDSAAYLQMLLKEMIHNEGESCEQRKSEVGHLDLAKTVAAVRSLLLNRRNPGDVYYLPANRGGMIQAHSTIVRTLIRRLQGGNSDSERDSPEMSGVDIDFLERLVGIANHPEREDVTFSRIAEKLEGEILKGKIEVEVSLAGYPGFRYRPSGWNRSMLLTGVSSMVSEVAPIDLFLHRVLERGDILVLEEPENNLHPEKQRQLMLTVAECVNAGLRVVLTTHSGWILEELSNVVARVECRTPDTHKTGLPSLSRRNVGVWRFDNQHEMSKLPGSVIKEVTWDFEIGGYEAGFHDVLLKQSDEWRNAVCEYIQDLD